MSAEVLREAARLMRDRAEDALLAAGDGAWEHKDLGYNDVQGMTYTVGSPEMRTCEADTEELAEHIASWHPAVALAVADWLARTADLWEYGDVGGIQMDYALAVARAYLGHPPQTSRGEVRRPES